MTTTITAHPQHSHPYICSLQQTKTTLMMNTLLITHHGDRVSTSTGNDLLFQYITYLAISEQFIH